MEAQSHGLMAESVEMEVLEGEMNNIQRVPEFGVYDDPFVFVPSFDASEADRMSDLVREMVWRNGRACINPPETVAFPTTEPNFRIDELPSSESFGSASFLMQGDEMASLLQNPFSAADRQFYAEIFPDEIPQDIVPLPDPYQTSYTPLPPLPEVLSISSGLETFIESVQQLPVDMALREGEEMEVTNPMRSVEVVSSSISTAADPAAFSSAEGKRKKRSNLLDSGGKVTTIDEGEEYGGNLHGVINSANPAAFSLAEERTKKRRKLVDSGGKAKRRYEDEGVGGNLHSVTAADPAAFSSAEEKRKKRRKSVDSGGKATRRDEGDGGNLQGVTAAHASSSRHGPSCGSKRKSRKSDQSTYYGHNKDEELGGDDCLIMEEESTKKAARKKRAAEVHNLSERRRRDKINEKLKELQQLIPRCTKVDKATMLDKAIEYLKSLKHQVEVLSWICNMPPTMCFGAPHFMHPMPMGMINNMNLSVPAPFQAVMASRVGTRRASAPQLYPCLPLPTLPRPSALIPSNKARLDKSRYIHSPITTLPHPS